MIVDRDLVGQAIQAAPTKAVITLGKETTRITEPLKANGTPDYVAALNAAHGAGVTKDNNALVLIVQALGPSMFADDIRPASMKTLGIDFPESKVLDVTYEDPNEYKVCLGGSFKASEHSKVADWLKANGPKLELVTAASKRPRYYNPVVISGTGKGPSLFSLALHSSAGIRGACRMFLIRANLATGEGRFAEASEDLLTIARLGKLLEQDSVLTGPLVGIGICSVADVGVQGMLTASGFDANSASDLLARISAIGTCETISVFDECERYLMLDTICYFASTPPEKADFRILDVRLDAMSAFEANRLIQQAKAADWDECLRTANKWYDRLISTMKMTNSKDRQTSLATYDKDFREFRESAVQAMTSEPNSPEFSKAFGDLIIVAVMPPLTKPFVLSKRCAVTRDLSIVSLGLTAYRSDKGHYPAALAELSPIYLKDVPKDYFSGNDLIYRTAGNGYMLYSVGDTPINDRDRLQNGTAKTSEIVIKVEQ